MKTVKVANMEIKPPKSTSGDFATPPMCIAGHCVVLCVGKRRSGKTTACTPLIEKMGFDYVIAVSATMASNKELMSGLNIQHEFDPDDPMVIDKIKEIVEGEPTDLERYQQEMRRYQKLMKLIQRFTRNPPYSACLRKTSRPSTETATSSHRSINGMAVSPKSP